MKTTPVLLLTGYLGAGKTTLLNRILSNRQGIRFAVIVNDIGEVNIDEALIRKEGIVGATPEGSGNSDDLVALQNGCICCTLQMNLVEQLTGLVASGKFDYIVIEASGICEPEPIARTIASIPGMGPKYAVNGVPRLDCIVTVVDALRLKSEFGDGESLNKATVAEDDIENLVIQQIEFCNIILLNKIDEVTRQDADRIKAVIRALQPKARIIECSYADIDFDRILNTGLFNYNEVATSATWVHELERELTPEEEAEGHHHEHDHHHGHDHEHEHHHDHDHDEDECPDPEHCPHHHHHHHHHGEGEALEYGISTMLYYRRKPFDLNKLDRMIAKSWPREIIRTKGILYFSQNPDMSYLFEQAGVQKKLTEAGQWFATAPEAELQMMLMTDPSLQRDWDPEYGDRMIKLVIIGRNLDKEAVTRLLDDCLK